MKATGKQKITWETWIHPGEEIQCFKCWSKKYKNQGLFVDYENERVLITRQEKYDG